MAAEKNKSRKISPIKDNYDKMMTYKEMIEKRNTAIENECYFEVFIINYAMLEDRLRSYLYYLGCLKLRTSYKFDNEIIEKDLLALLADFSGKEVKMPDISTISGKIAIIKKVNQWAINNFPNNETSNYLKILAECIDLNTDSMQMLDILEKLRDWCDYRNEVIHSLLNKNLESLYKELSLRADEGFVLAREIDKAVRKLKNNGNIRSTLGLEVKEK